ncbi:VWA domain-containing protein [Oceanobacter mangrovi]|uniref:VWA domain-containing protein n=1 Tax=Oceanobacter mangrovi TaxID=2862510 RepID=UPI001C8EC026|nr:VWA domain-containing protein [Oceanobacter mangrovi]
MAELLKQRWRLVLGRYADDLNANLSSQQQGQDQVLQTLYQQGLVERGFDLSGGLESGEPQIIQWLEQAEKLFPRSVNDKLQQDAVDHYGLTDVLKQPGVLDKITPSVDLLKQLMKLNAHHNPALRDQVERIIRGVVEELLRKLMPVFSHCLTGRLNRQAHSPVKRLANLDWQTTIRKNLKNFDGERLRYERVYFNARQQTSLPWRVILCIDQSGSMAESMIYSAVIAGILTRLPTVKLSLVVFDTRVVDLSEHADDPVSVMLRTQLGGGTLIGQAWQYCEQLVSAPQRTVVATVSDFCEGGPLQGMLGQAAQMVDSGIKMLGMTAMTSDSTPFYNSQSTSQLQQLGMDINALSPDQFADWLARVMGFRK